MCTHSHWMNQENIVFLIPFRYKGKIKCAKSIFFNRTILNQKQKSFKKTHVNKKNCIVGPFLLQKYLFFHTIDVLCQNSGGIHTIDEFRVKSFDIQDFVLTYKYYGLIICSVDVLLSSWSILSEIFINL